LFSAKTIWRAARPMRLVICICALSPPALFEGYGANRTQPFVQPAAVRNAVPSCGTRGLAGWEWK
jgi:hypothetical protein